MEPLKNNTKIKTRKVKLLNENICLIGSADVLFAESALNKPGH